MPKLLPMHPEPHLLLLFLDSQNPLQMRHLPLGHKELGGRNWLRPHILIPDARYSLMGLLPLMKGAQRFVDWGRRQPGFPGSYNHDFSQFLSWGNSLQSNGGLGLLARETGRRCHWLLFRWLFDLPHCADCGGGCKGLKCRDSGVIGSLGGS